MFQCVFLFVKRVSDDDAQSVKHVQCRTFVLLCLVRLALIRFISIHFNQTVYRTIASFGHSNHLPMRQVNSYCFNICLILYMKLKTLVNFENPFFILLRYNSIRFGAHSFHWAVLVGADHKFLFGPFTQFKFQTKLTKPKVVRKFWMKKETLTNSRFLSLVWLWIVFPTSIYVHAHTHTHTI